MVLIRHAQAVCNVAQTWAGHDTCAGLSPAGRAQGPLIARRAREVCGAGSDVVLVSSVMRRAVETAEYVAAELGSAAFTRRCDLCERHPGSLDGAPLATLDRALIDRGELPAGPELPAAFVLRARRALRQLAATHPDRTVVVVTHGGVIAASFCAFGGVPARLPFRLDVSNGALTEWSTRDVRAGPWQLERYNDVPR
jgi:broad specificity phosphatase PhoE